MVREIAGWLVLGIGSTGAGLLAQGVGIPAAWLVGPLVVAMVYALTRRGPPQNVPPLSRMVAQAIIGIALAASFRPAALPTIIANWPAVTLAVAGTLLFSLLGGLALSRISGLEPKTAAIGTLPGAAVGMMTISDYLGADTRLVALIQYSRVVLVVLSATLISRFFTTAGGFAGGDASAIVSPSTSLTESGPIYGATAVVALIGAWGGRRLRVPAGTLIGPLIFGVVLKELEVLNVALPFGLSQIAYAVIGIYVGLLFDSASVRRAGGLLPAVLASTVGLMAACTGLGWILSALTGTDMLTAYLATTPGGLSSVAVIAIESGADPSLAVAVQILRVFAVILVAPLLTRRWLRSNCNA